MIPHDFRHIGRDHPDCPPLPERVDLAAAHLRGPAAAVEARWEWTARSWEWSAAYAVVRSPSRVYPRIVELVAAARAVPELRRLYPFTSHTILKFSSTTTIPYEVRLPSVEPTAGGRFRVRRGGEVLGEFDGTQEALALVLAHAPPGLGPAVPGESGRGC
ncbi:DUF6193 family natural product biosynthesis protein [Streptomyces lavendulae]|uniref:DUF6193 family natural product biosynthesis protein n=1 Tax=Streptomyces lavendulae TaxID=1914 RepID=UPI0024A3996C|nr:DUF6193 family natural product biosynthesis protein [Streptomyces lavendulae]GLX21562.1 hypothetical protein Slala01_52060 [Streptomyces lavendulae subsp. lavendulae]GLX28979.1 hypothetical protein Slala02_47990 [Streptomyces lavendulae subsp. lavendulae]